MGRPRGRPKKNKDPNLDETQGEGIPGPVSNYYGKRNVQYSLAERIRERHDPEVIIKTIEMVMMGHTPVWIPDKRAVGGFRVEPDPNPLLPTPNLEQRTAAMRELINRGWGLPVQSVQIDAQIKQQLDAGLPAHLLDKPNYRLLAEMNDLIKKYKEEDIVDAELIEPKQLQESSQVAEATKLENSDQLQEACQVVADVVEDLILNNESTNEYKELSNPGSVESSEDSEK